MSKQVSPENAKQRNKENIRKQIIAAAQSYSSDLAGKVFLYVYGEEYFEVLFATQRFKHLTGVSSALPAKQFYTLAKDRKITTNQFNFDQSHTYDGAKKKLPCLIKLSVLTNSTVCVVKEFKTLTFTYSIGVTNLHFTLCLTDDIDGSGAKRSDYLVPRSLRVKDKAIENSKDGEFIDFIFMKDASKSIYSDILYKDDNKTIPNTIAHLVDKKFYSDN